MTVRVLIVDDHAMVRQGLTHLLGASDGIEVVAAVGTGEEALVGVIEHRPDVVLMDLQMPGMGGVEATRQIVSGGAQTEVLVLTSFSDGERILAALDAGAVGYLLKDSEPDDLVDGVLAVARGESPLDPKAARTLLTRRRSPSGSEGLTAREVEVLRHLRGGLANKQIARRLGISERTIKAHLTSAYTKIGVRDRTQAAMWAQENDL